MLFKLLAELAAPRVTAAASSTITCCLTRQLQLGLGLALLVVNAVAYVLVWRLRRRR
jgi:hypothetical protein